jgi:hypothetical protein
MDFIGLLPKFAVMIYHRPPCVVRVVRGANVGRCSIGFVGGPTLRAVTYHVAVASGFSHMGQRREGLCERRRVLWTPHIILVVCV